MLLLGRSIIDEKFKNVGYHVPQWWGKWKRMPYSALFFFAFFLFLYTSERAILFYVRLLFEFTLSIKLIKHSRESDTFQNWCRCRSSNYDQMKSIQGDWYNWCILNITWCSMCYSGIPHLILKKTLLNGFIFRCCHKI